MERDNTVAVIGQGYVGFPLSMAAINAGWKVIGIDSFLNRVLDINKGVSHIDSVSEDKLASALASEKYLVTSDYKMVAKAKVVIICVPTPLDIDLNPDLSHLMSAINGISPHIRNKTLIVNESTSYPGTLRNVIARTIRENLWNREKDLYFAVAPERVNPGDKVWNQENTPRIIAGIDEGSHKLAVEFYKTITKNLVESDFPEEAEAAKLLENTFRLVNISFINEFANVCRKSKLNVDSVIKLASTKPYGFMPFQPSIGAGGHCIPIDPIYYSWWAKNLGEETEVTDAAAKLNREFPIRVADAIFDLLPQSNQKPKIMVVGISYKKGVADFRESPAITLIEELEKRRATVIWHDPMISEWDGSKSSDIDSLCDFIVLTVHQPDLDIDSLIGRGVPILNCTNTYIPGKNIHKF
jgi:UDP-N-acetyl-D-glucosamine dehydrogenase